MPKKDISQEILNTIVDPTIVKFVDDYRQLKQGVSKGAVKRKATPTKKAPLRKSKPAQTKRANSESTLRSKVLSGNANAGEEKDFLKAMAERSLGNV